MKYSKEYISKRLKEMSEVDFDKIPLETFKKAAVRIDDSIKKYHEECKRANICPLTGEQIYSSDEWNKLMNKRFDC